MASRRGLCFGLRLYAMVLPVDAAQASAKAFHRDLHECSAG